MKRAKILIMLCVVFLFTGCGSLAIKRLVLPDNYLHQEISLKEGDILIGLECSNDYDECFRQGEFSLHMMKEISRNRGSWNMVTVEGNNETLGFQSTNFIELESKSDVSKGVFYIIYKRGSGQVVFKQNGSVLTVYNLH